MSAENQYITLFNEQRSLIDRHANPLLNNLRDEAYGHFCRMGLPTRKIERYRYTDVKKAFSPEYGLNLARLDFPVTPSNVFRCDVPNLSTQLYFVVNDSFYDKVLPKSPLPEGVVICSLNRAAREYPELVRKYYGQQADVSTDALSALNTMFVQDGLFIYVPRATKLEKPIQVVNLLRSTVDLMVNRRVLIILEEEAEAQFLFCDHAIDNKNFLSTQVMEIHVADRASLALYELEETHEQCRRFSNTYVRLATESRATLNTVTLQTGLTRNQTDVTLSGEGSSVALYGGVIAGNGQYVENNTFIDHKAGKCQSEELYKYVLEDNAVGAFAGRVLVRENAQQTVSKETSANLCTSRNARMYTQPMLEIYADDVKCSHGSTVGQLNDAAIFYMQQRGIPADEARLLMKFAFIGEVIDTIPMTILRDRLHYLIEKRFRGELGKCAGCKAMKGPDGNDLSDI